MVNGQWSDRRVIIFTEYRATQKWLHNLLAAEGLAGPERLLTICGGMPLDDRERYTLSESARRTVLDRFLALNHQRYQEKVKAGLHKKKRGAKARTGF